MDMEFKVYGHCKYINLDREGTDIPVVVVVTVEVKVVVSVGDAGTPQFCSSSPLSQSSVPSHIQSGFTQSLGVVNGHWHHSEVQQVP